MIKSLKGTQDYWFQDTKKWQYIEKILFNTLNNWGYDEVRTPIIEPAAVFEKLGDESDVVGKQMYRITHPTEAIVLRPEGTASIVRSGIEHHKITRSNAKVWYYGPMFRHERPQKGRLRQFHQLGAEIFGDNQVSMETEMLDMLFKIWEKLGVAHTLTLEINSIGSIDTRSRYKTALIDFLTPHKDELDEDSQRRLHTNPLRILDSKNVKTQHLLTDAPELADYLSEDEQARFNTLLDYLTRMGHKWVHNKKLVRGLDYYNDLVFEFTTQDLGSQGTVCAGGRYDTLASTWGNHNIPAVGFSLGMERLIELVPELPEATDEHIVAFTQVDESSIDFMKLINDLRSIFPGKIIIDHAKSNFNNKYKRALKTNPVCVLTVEEDDWNNKTISIRSPGKSTTQSTWNAQEIITLCR